MCSNRDVYNKVKNKMVHVVHFKAKKKKKNFLKTEQMQL